MADLTYTQIYSMTSEQINQAIADKMEEKKIEDIASINIKLSEIGKVQEARKKLYPSIQEQLDMQYWDSINGTTKWKDKIAEIKAAEPLPKD